jgi:NADH:ubiquinone oxidoreductase subunit K
MFMAIHLNFSYATLFLDDIFGLVIILFILAISGCEISIGLAFFILLYRTKNILLTDKLILIKG